MVWFPAASFASVGFTMANARRLLKSTSNPKGSGHIGSARASLWRNGISGFWILPTRLCNPITGSFLSSTTISGGSRWGGGPGKVVFCALFISGRCECLALFHTMSYDHIVYCNYGIISPVLADCLSYESFLILSV